ncbi:hypothetical protein [Romboutsia sp.]|uniref:hypothetical protein n=1 Tax=Romboutsia sp. TaxID=1965302 RepID=UPI002C9851B9|nr:hypothetical protein [Romboutsia sp.]HSQ90191.1 hypothetical protein [Romboutsia sp.]
MEKPKFKKGDRVRINPSARSGDFTRNGCTSRFLRRCDEEFVISKSEVKPNRIIYYIDGWWMVEQCLINAREDNEV